VYQDETAARPFGRAGFFAKPLRDSLIGYNMVQMMLRNYMAIKVSRRLHASFDFVQDRQVKRVGRRLNRIIQKDD
jgi:hypothetical protein